MFCATQNSVLMFLYREDTDDVLNPITETCPASQKSFKNQLHRPGQQLSCTPRPWPGVRAGAVLGGPPLPLRAVDGAPTLVPAGPGVGVGERGTPCGSSLGWYQPLAG